MDHNKKELKSLYKQIKPEMGVFSFKCLASGTMYVGCSQNIKADINSITFQLNLGNFNKNSNLQKDWKTFGEKQFETLVLEVLKYDNNELKTNYTEDLFVLRDCYCEKLTHFEYI